MSFRFRFYRLGAHRRVGVVGTEQDFDVQKIIQHPSYQKPVRLAHDIALLKLKKSASINKNVGTACLPEAEGRVPVGKKCWVTGTVEPLLNGHLY